MGLLVNFVINFLLLYIEKYGIINICNLQISQTSRRYTIMTKWENQSARNILALLTSDEYTNRKEVLVNVCSSFNAAGIRYALSCSAALFLQGLVDDFNDFDILVHIDDVNKMEETMKLIGAELLPTIQKPNFTSPYYQEALLQGEHFDLVGDITVATFNKEYCYPVKVKECQYISVEGIIDVVPVIPIEASFLLYGMMEGWQSKRVFKRELCKDFLLNAGLAYPEIFENALACEQLPQWLSDLVKELLRMKK